jgi:hypothetical protein
MLSNVHITELRGFRRGFLFLLAQECRMESHLRMPLVPETTIPYRCMFPFAVQNTQSQEIQALF